MRRAFARLGHALTIAMLAVVLLGGGRIAAAAPAADHATATDTKVEQLLQLLSDPEVRHALAQHHDVKEAPAPQPAGSDTMTASLGDRLQTFRNHLRALAAAEDDVPSQVHMAQSMAVDALQQRGLASTILALVTFVILGFGAQGLFQVVAGPARRWLLALRLETVDERIKAVLARLVYGLGLQASFAIGSIGAFLLFDWPTLIKTLLLGALFAVVTVRLAAISGRFLLAPGSDRFRIVPITTRAAWFFYVRLIAAAIVTSFGWQTLVALGRFGLSPIAQEFLSDIFSTLLLVLGLETVWRMPPPSPKGASPLNTLHIRRTLGIVGSVVLVLLWVLWIVQATLLFGLVAFAVLLPITIATARASVAHILRPEGEALAINDFESFQAALFERGARSLIIISAALILAWIFNIDVVSLTMDDTVGTRLLRGLINVIVITLAAEFLWTLVRAGIRQKLARPLPHGSNAVDLGHAARLQTLLPIVSNILLAAIAIIATMMVLGAVGVEIGPLIASAGVVGVAIGFGAQTLVKDVISGIFYLVDDAFRIGEYIQSGNYKGTVESFSLRSVKLRHQRGALYTVPFGVLGAVQNQSRDWVVDKIVMNVPYGTDLDKVRRLIKKIGIELSQDPEFAEEIITPLKMQGVQQFGDFAIQIQTKMMTKPGDVQFMARRRALLLIKLAFEEHGIGFAVPTVQVSNDMAQAAAAAHSLSLMAGAKAAE